MSVMAAPYARRTLPSAPPLPGPARPPRAPKAPRPLKARTADECELLEQLPNIGPSIAGDLRLLGIQHPRELAEHDALALYRALCDATGKRQDPCVLDTFMAAVDFMRGAEPRPWWSYTAERKARHGVV
ncbi:mitomycin resistance protein [Rubrivivax benzoatilyticus]|uniref:Mitomycin resistance protein n=2 Tax=Sphaerotilaceae TaxID=2975441 RepID=A0ABX0HTX8_9BURK|nr:putative mitomycin resistance protein [Rubrivivax benzoatilyticus JA2 = ATCC BAA-35]NHK98483.1 mitomycin resistance protein [Rubrivivax benzoatilyticus]NHL23742.1 mitomycin resistance protein [Rubrivivax benzoatilyticus]